MRDNQPDLSYCYLLLPLHPERSVYVVILNAVKDPVFCRCLFYVVAHFEVD